MKSKSVTRGATLMILLGTLVPRLASAEGTWTPLNSLATNTIGVMLLLSDGTVMAYDSNFGSPTKIWYKLTPDASGHYVNGTWSATAIAPMNYPRGDFASQVLTNGQVFVAGGEYGANGTYDATAEVYDPVANTWTVVTPPTCLINPNGPDSPCFGDPQGFSDMISETLTNGDVLMAPVYPMFIGETLIFDPAGNTWSDYGGELANGECDQSECSWVKLADGSILTIDSSAESSERYIYPPGEPPGWYPDAEVPVPVFDPYIYEEGPGFLLPNGNAIFIGSLPNTAIYIPSQYGGINAGEWVAGPSLTFTNVNGPATYIDCNRDQVSTPNPLSLGAPDAPAAMMVNGKILCALSQAPSSGNPCKLEPTYFFEYDYANTNAENPYGTFTQIHAPGGGYTYGGTTDGSTMLDLPDGTVLYVPAARSSDGNGMQLWVYTPDGSPLAGGQPTITSIAQYPDGSYLLTGTGLSGISEGAAFGDDAQMATDYPLVQLSADGNVYYARTYNWSGPRLHTIQTSTGPQSTDFTLPPTLPSGCYSLVVVANGIASAPYKFCYQFGASNAPPFLQIYVLCPVAVCDQFIVSWTPHIPKDGGDPFVLQTSTNVAGPWTDIIGATNPYTNMFAASQQFFRLAFNATNSLP